MVFVDVDDTIRAVHGYAKQAAGFGYSRVRGLNVQLATVSTPTAAPVIARARLRRGNVISHAGAPRLIAQAVRTARGAGAGGQVMVRADSAYYLCDVLARGAAPRGVVLGDRADEPGRRQGHRRDRPRRVDADQVPEGRLGRPGRWVGLRRPGRRGRVHRVHVPAQAQAGPRPPGGAPGPAPAATHVRRVGAGRAVRRLAPPRVRDELRPEHGRGRPAPPRPRDHRAGHRRAQGRPLAHLPSGSYAANAAWVSFAALAFNLARAASVAAGMATARWATLRRRIITIPARLATTGRRLIMHLPARWPWAPAWAALWDAATGPPRPTLT